MFIFTRQVFTLDKYACMENTRKAVNTMYGQRKTNSGDPSTKIIFGEKKEKSYRGEVHIGGIYVHNILYILHTLSIGVERDEK